MPTTTMPGRPAPPAQPTRPRPLWERHQLFQEPKFPEGLTLLEDDTEEDDE